MFWRKKKSEPEPKYLIDICEVVQNTLNKNSERIEKFIGKIEDEIREASNKGIWSVEIHYYPLEFNEEEINCIKQLFVSGGFEVSDSNPGTYIKHFVISWEHMKSLGTVLD